MEIQPSGAQQIGGIWERLIQSCKNVMIAKLDNRSVTDHILRTTMCPVAQTLNARPLTAVGDDPEVLTALTPNHFSEDHKTLVQPLCHAASASMTC